MKNVIFKLNETVEWTSQAGGSTTTKTGKIVKVIKRDYHIVPFIIADIEFPNHKRMFDGWRIPGNSAIGYFVEVIVGPKATPRIYMPYPSKLKKITTTE